MRRLLRWFKTARGFLLPPFPGAIPGTMVGGSAQATLDFREDAILDTAFDQITDTVGDPIRDVN